MKVLRFAREIDRSGQRFYEEMAERAESEGVRSIFQELAEDEARLLSRMESRAGADGLDSPALDRGINVFEELRHQEDRLAVADDLTAYRLALDAERQVVTQYESTAEAEQDPSLRRILREIAADERQLLEELEERFDFANVPNNYLAWGEFSNLGEFHNFGRDVG